MVPISKTYNRLIMPKDTRQRNVHRHSSLSDETRSPKYAGRGHMGWIYAVAEQKKYTLPTHCCQDGAACALWHSVSQGARSSRSSSLNSRSSSALPSSSVHGGGYMDAGMLS